MQRLWVGSLETGYECEVRDIGDDDTCVWRSRLETTDQQVQVMRVACKRNTVSEIIDRQPHGDQVGMAIKRHRQLDVERVMQVYTGYTEIDEVNPIPQLFSQISSPILTCWIISTQAKGIGGSNGNIG